MLFALGARIGILAPLLELKNVQPHRAYYSVSAKAKQALRAQNRNSGAAKKISAPAPSAAVRDALVL